MSKPTLKTVERKTTVPRAKVRKAIAVSMANSSGNIAARNRKETKQETSTKNKTD